MAAPPRGDLSMEADQGGSPPALTHLVLSDVKGLTAVLQAVKPAAKQVASVIVSGDGLSLRWEDDSKTLQSSIYLSQQLFSSFDTPPEERVFGLQLSQLVDALGAFAAASEGGGLCLSYPGPEGELQLEMRDAPAAAPIGGGAAPAGAAVSMYARIATLEQPVPRDMTEYWADPVSYFLTRGALLKEAVEDLEWPCGPVVLSLQRDPPGVTMRATGTAGSLEVELPSYDLLGFSASSQRVSHTYAYRNLRAALSHVPTLGRGGDAATTSTKVSIDSSGLLRVTHLVGFSAAPRPGGTGFGGSTAPPLSSLPGGGSLGVGTQGGTLLDASRTARVQFVAVPQVDDDSDDGAAPGPGLGGL